MSYYQQVYNAFRQHGLSEAGALGLLGNADCESNCEPYRVQGDFSSYRSISKAYVKAIEDGQLSKQQFAYDGKGFGIFQWTYPTRKAELYDMAKQTGQTIDSVQLQVDFTVRELKRDYSSLYRFLCDTMSVYDACYRVCTEFERPAVNNVDARWQAACQIKQMIELNSWEGSIPQDDQIEPVDDQVKCEYWPPRVIDKNMTGLDVQVLQAVLWAREYGISYIDGIFGSYLEDVVKKFQKEHGLTADGIVGPLTWAELLKR